MTFRRQDGGMTQTIDRSALVMHSAQRMFELVNDVHSCPKFLPWCASSSVLSKSDEHMVAMLEIAKGGLRHQFTTRNMFAVPNEIQLELVEGPFSQLQGVWRFLPLDAGACKVMLSLNFEFSGLLAKMAVGAVFSQAANSMVDAFCKRANEVYGY